MKWSHLHTAAVSIAGTVLFAHDGWLILAGITVAFALGKEWWLDGKRHRADGPAIEYADGTKEWWLDGTWTWSR